jgi:hypothetical protein
VLNISLLLVEVPETALGVDMMEVSEEAVLVDLYREPVYL